MARQRSLSTSSPGTSPAEIEGTGVTANVIHPGDVKTAMWEDIRDKMGTVSERGYHDWVAWVEQTGGDPPEKGGQARDRHHRERRQRALSLDRRSAADPDPELGLGRAVGPILHRPSHSKKNMPPHYPPLYLRPNSERTVRNGHPWVFSGAVERPPRDADTGDIVDVFDAHERFVCRGFYNRRSLIRVRSLTQDPSRPIDAAFFKERIAQAIALRRSTDLAVHTNAMRLVHGESDGLPGLIADDYAGYLVVQFHTAGMEKQRRTILDALQSLLAPRSLYERSDVGTRRAEGLDDRPTGLLAGEAPPEFVEIEEHGTRLYADLYRGQKTGFFLDQRANRCYLQQLARDQRVLNLFSYSSGFSAHALKGGASRTLDVDISPQVVPAARRTLAANRPQGSHSDLLIADVFPFCGRAGRPRPPLRYRRLRPTLADAQTQPVQTGHGRLYQTQSQRLPPNSRRRTAGDRLVLVANFPRGLFPNRPPRRRWCPSPHPHSHLQPTPSRPSHRPRLSRRALP